MIAICLLIGSILGGGCVALICLWREKKRVHRKETFEKEKIDISLQDLIRIATCNTDASYLILEYKINVKMPEFYEKYQALKKQDKDLYINELIDIFSRNKREYVRGLLDKYISFTKQDVLLLLMCEMQLYNKNMARILGLSQEALKKRKTRLKTKMRPGSPSSKGEGAA